jgi:WD40 repeat protein/serine/threonine protein kinase
MSVDPQVTLLERLREADLLEPAQLAELASLPESRDPDPRALGRVLVRRRLLSLFQVNQVAAGKAKELRLGNFLLLDRLGEGGMGQVFKARHLRMGRIVALKLMRKEKLGNPASVKRFYQEVEAASQLNHPNIVVAYDADEIRGLHYFSMEYVEGSDLARQVKENGPLPVAVACEYIRQAAVGLQHAHEKGLVHRDIKPHNLLVGTNGGAPVVKILDMGLARLQGKGETGLTQAGQVLGTPDYLAPEQAYDSRKADIRSDIYSLGCTLYFLLAGRAPFTGETLAQVLLMHQMEEPTPLKQRRAEVPAALAAVVHKMMAKQPGERYQSPAEVADALAALARGEDVPIVPVVPVAPVAAVADSGGNDAWATLAGDSDKLVSRPAGRKERRAAEDTYAEETPARRGRKRVEEEQPNRTLLYVLIGAGAAVPVLGAVILGLVLLLGNSSKPRPEGGGENQGLIQAGPKKTPGKTPVRPPEDPPVPGGPGMDGDIFNAIAQAVKAGKIVRGPAPGGGQQEFYDVPEEGALLIGLELGLGKFGVQDVIHSIRPIYQTRRGRALGPRQGPPLDRVETLEAKPGYAVGDISLRTGAGLDSLAVTFMAIEGQALNPAQSYTTARVGGQGGFQTSALAGSGAPVVGIFGRVGGPTGTTGRLGLVTVGEPPPPALVPGSRPVPKEALVRTFGGHRPLVKQVLLSPDGKQALSLDSLTVRLWDMNSPARVRYFRGHRGTITEMAVSKDWRRLLTGGADGTVRCWDLGTGQQLHRLDNPGKASVRCVALTDDGRYAASGHGTSPSAANGNVVRVWDLQTGKEVRAFSGHTGPVHSVAITADGKTVVATDDSAVFRIWHVEGRPQMSSSAPANLTKMRVSLLADGRTIAFFGQDGSVHTCDLQSPTRTFPLPGHPRTSAVFLAKDGKRALVASGSALMKDGEGYSVQLLELPGRKELVKFAIPAASLSLSMSEDGRFALTGSNDGTVRLWDLTKLGVTPGPPVAVAAGGELARLDLKQGGVADLALGPKGRALVFGAMSLGVVDAVEGKLTRTIPVENPAYIACLAVAPDERHVLAGCRDNHLRLYDTTDGKVVRTFEGHTSNPFAVAFSPDGDLAASAAGKIEPGGKTVDCTVRIWEVKTGKELHRLEGHKSLVRGVRFTPDGKQVISIAWTSDLRVWNVADGKEVKSARLSSNPNGNGFSLSRDGKRILYPGDGAFVLWDVEQDREVRRLRLPVGSMPLGVAFCGDRHAVTGSGGHKFEGGQLVRDSNNKPVVVDCLVRVWDLETGSVVKTFSGHEHFVQKVVCSPDGRRAYSAGADHTLRIWDLSGSLSVPPPPAPVEAAFKGHEGVVNAVAISSDGKYVVTGGDDSTVRLWEASGKVLRPPFTARGPVRGVGISSDGKLVCAADAEGWGWVWETETGRLRRGSSSGRKGVLADACVLIPDGSAFIFSSGTTLRTYPLMGARGTRSTTGRARIQALACSADSSTLASGNADGVVQWLDLRTNKPMSRLSHKGAVLALAFAPQGDRLVSGGADKLMLLHDLRTMKAPRKIIGHNSAVHAVAFSPDGKWIVSGSRDTTVRLWDATTLKEEKLFGGHKGPVRGVAFDPKGKFIISCGDTIRVWELPESVVIKPAP